MRMHCQQQEQVSVLKLTGAFGAEDTDPFRVKVQECLDQDLRDFVLEMHEVEFVDSKALETLLWLLDQCEEKLGQVRLAAVHENVAQILRMTRLSGRFICEADVETACRSLR